MIVLLRDLLILVLIKISVYGSALLITSMTYISVSQTCIHMCLQNQVWLPDKCTVIKMCTNVQGKCDLVTWSSRDASNIENQSYFGGKQSLIWHVATQGRFQHRQASNGDSSSGVFVGLVSDSWTKMLATLVTSNQSFCDPNSDPPMWISGYSGIRIMRIESIEYPIRIRFLKFLFKKKL